VDITQQLLGSFPAIRVSGDLDRGVAPALEKAFRVHIRAGNHRLLLDLGECTYIDSGGLAAIITTVGELRDDGLLAIVAPGVSIRRLLDVVGLYEHKRCAIFKTESEALASLAQSPWGAPSWDRPSSN
jgi:anti-anti-sigma factor